MTDTAEIAVARRRCAGVGQSKRLPICSAFAPATPSSCPSRRQAISTRSSRGIWRDYEHQNGAVVIDSADYVR